MLSLICIELGQKVEKISNIVYTDKKEVWIMAESIINKRTQPSGGGKT